MIKIRLPSSKNKTQNEMFADYQNYLNLTQFEWDEHFNRSFDVCEIKRRIDSFESEYCKNLSDNERDKFSIKEKMEVLEYQINHLWDEMEMLNKYLAAAKKYKDMEEDFTETK